MTGRRCAECRQTFTRLRPPVAPVALREDQPGYGVPRLAIAAQGALCAACARAGIPRVKP